jgi:hypothetical protein
LIAGGRHRRRLGERSANAAGQHEQGGRQPKAVNGTHGHSLRGRFYGWSSSFQVRVSFSTAPCADQLRHSLRRLPLSFESVGWCRSFAGRHEAIQAPVSQPADGQVVVIEEIDQRLIQLRAWTSLAEAVQQLQGSLGLGGFPAARHAGRS